MLAMKNLKSSSKNTLLLKFKELSEQIWRNRFSSLNINASTISFNPFATECLPTETTFRDLVLDDEKELDKKLGTWMYQLREICSFLGVSERFGRFGLIFCGKEQNRFLVFDDFRKTAATNRKIIYR